MECVYNTGTNEGPRVAPTQSTPSRSGSGSGGHGASNPLPSRVLWTTLGLMGPGALVLIPPYISPSVIPALDTPDGIADAPVWSLGGRWGGRGGHQAEDRESKWTGPDSRWLGRSQTRAAMQAGFASL